jgi:hypothetical protein
VGKWNGTNVTADQSEHTSGKAYILKGLLPRQDKVRLSLKKIPVAVHFAVVGIFVDN